MKNKTSENITIGDTKFCAPLFCDGKYIGMVKSSPVGYYYQKRNSILISNYYPTTDDILDALRKREIEK